MYNGIPIMSMLTSSQYLQPDYLQPLPTTMDAKNSPLALLAQTCNNIGKDANNSKSLIPPFEKDKKKDGEKSGRESVTSNPGSGQVTTKDKTTRDKSGSPNNKHSSSKSSDLIVNLKRSPPPPALLSLKREDDTARPTSHSPKERDSKSRDGLRTGSSIASSDRLYNSSSSNSLLSSSNHITSSHTNGLHKSDSLLYPSHLSPLSGYPSLAGYPFTSGLAGASTAAILAAHKHNPESVRYTTVRTASGATTMVPICSDPYCTYCKVTLQSVQLASSAASSCGAGCVQCTHDKTIGLPPSYPTTTLASGLLGMPSLHGLSYPGSTAASSHTSPYVCSWIGTGGFCGKRFGSSEELVSHLRSHTSSLDIPSPLSGLPLSGLSSAAAAAAAAGLSASHLYPGSALGSLSPSALRQAYPRSLSPTSVLAVSRFHPYLKSSLSGLPTSAFDAGSLPSVHPSLGAYSSLYSLYGHKLGVP